MLKHFLLIAALPVYLTACNRPPEACIQTDMESAAVGTPVTFTSCSKRALSQDWFMTGPDSAAENSMGWSDASFTHTFTMPGTYEVRLNAYSKFSFMGDVRSTTQSFTVN